MLDALSLDGPADLGKCVSEAAASKSGGGSCKSCLEDDANAIASGPYGTANLANESRDEMTFSCSGVGPAFGYVNSVRLRVCVRGAEMELREIMEGEFRRLEARVFVERCRERVRNMDEVR